MQKKKGYGGGDQMDEDFTSDGKRIMNAGKDINGIGVGQEETSSSTETEREAISVQPLQQYIRQLQKTRKKIWIHNTR